MIKFSFVFLILFTIGVFSAVHPELAASVVPGWDTLILPPRTIVLLFQILWLGVAAVIYYLTERKGRAVSQICFKIHLFSSLTVFVDSTFAVFEDHLRIPGIVILYSIFLLGQSVFLSGVFSAKKRNVSQLI
ncbi:MAG: hypothetical protein EOP48_02175 [Sphingobacteriales bacterium]|nr:MAG: hypothetical protein EOP48_02175 [Sphingobacteriales bacterium]